MSDIEYYRERLTELLAEARADGVVIRVDLVPRAVAMGAYEMTPDLRMHQKGKNFGDSFPSTPSWPAARIPKKVAK